MKIHTGLGRSYKHELNESLVKYIGNNLDILSFIHSYTLFCVDALLVQNQFFFIEKKSQQQNIYIYIYIYIYIHIYIYTHIYTYIYIIT